MFGFGLFNGTDCSQTGGQRAFIPVMIIDTHCHLASRQFDQSARESYVRHAIQEGVGRMITLGAAVSDWHANVQWAQQFPGTVFCALGIHPDDAHQAPADWAVTLRELNALTPMAAIGESGLDYFHPAPQGWDDAAFHRRQQELLEEHFQLAESMGLNLVLHTRDRKGSRSFEDAIAIAKHYAGRVRPVFHCFIGDMQQARRVFDELDGMLSFTGVATFKNAPVVAETARLCPAERIMLETDSPYLSPEPLRGRMNQPAHLIRTARFIAAARGIKLQELAQFTTLNAEKFFKIGASEKKFG